jgi:hypothetical protein
MRRGLWLFLNFGGRVLGHPGIAAEFAMADDANRSMAASSLVFMTLVLLGDSGSSAPAKPSTCAQASGGSNRRQLRYARRNSKSVRDAR